MPTRTLLGPIRTKVTTTSSPTRIRSPAFLDSTNMISYSLTFLFSKLPCVERADGVHTKSVTNQNPLATRRRIDTDIRMIHAAQGTPTPKSPKSALPKKQAWSVLPVFWATGAVGCQNGVLGFVFRQNRRGEITDHRRNWPTARVWSKYGRQVARIKTLPLRRFRLSNSHPQWLSNLICSACSFIIKEDRYA